MVNFIFIQKEIGIYRVRLGWYETPEKNVQLCQPSYIIKSVNPWLGGVSHFIAYCILHIASLTSVYD